MGSDLQRWAPVYSCCHWLRSRNSPPPLPPHLGSYTRALLVSQDRRHLFDTPWVYSLCKIKNRIQEHFPFSRDNLRWAKPLVVFIRNKLIMKTEDSTGFPRGSAETVPDSVGNKIERFWEILVQNLCCCSHNLLRYDLATYLIHFPVLWILTRMICIHFGRLDPGPDPGGQKWPTTVKRIYVLKFWMFSFKASFMEAWDK